MDDSRGQAGDSLTELSNAHTAVRNRPTAAGGGMDLFRCPECRGSLVDLVCVTCEATYGASDEIPDLLGSGPLAARYREIGAYYDDLYSRRTDVWREHGHSDELTRYITGLVEARGPGRYLDVGCGEGFFLTRARSMERFGVDLSRKVLLKARARSQATVAIAAAERLPFPDRAFDVVTSIGALEHFLDDVTAVTEIRRVLRPQGRFILLLLVDDTALRSRLAIKFREFLWPRPRPAAFGRWVLRKLRGGAEPALPADFVRQPVQNQYRPAQARAVLLQRGFRMARVITKARYPDVPLPGHYMRIYCLEAV
jgi:SAM-dependent methyltransferase